MSGRKSRCPRRAPGRSVLRRRGDRSWEGKGRRRNAPQGLHTHFGLSVFEKIAASYVRRSPARTGNRYNVRCSTLAQGTRMSGKPRESLIKTPKQLVVVLALAFVAPIIVIVLFAQLATSGRTY